MSSFAKLSPDFYTQENTLSVCRQLLGKKLCTLIDGILTCGIIVETEAYRGPEDLGSHAYNNRRTTRNDVMYAEGGVVYMYICYGIHDMLNIVTGKEGSSHAILIRALQPTEGIPEMRARRGTQDLKRLCKGPGALAKALGLSKKHNGTSLQSDVIWVEDTPALSAEHIVETSRVGLNIQGVYRDIPWRFYIKGNPFISRK
jgi:DNA-3-methyladenine glycosylase